MKKENKEIRGLKYSPIILITYLVVKIILNYIGISNIPSYILITITLLSFTTFVINTVKSKITKKEKIYNTVFITLLGLICVIFITIIITKKYYLHLFFKYEAFFKLSSVILFILLGGFVTIINFLRK